MLARPNEQLPERILVTGGAGFIGSALCRYLVGVLKCAVLNIDALTYASNLGSLAPISANPLYRFVKADITDLLILRRVLAEFQPGGIVHLAAQTHVDRSIDNAMPFIDANVKGTGVLLEAAREYWKALPSPQQARFRLVSVSTDEVYGSLVPGQAAFRENSLYDPSSPYAASKAAADHLVLAWHRTYGLPTIVSNCSNNFGPYQFPEKLIPLTIINALEGKSITVYGTGQNIRDWLHVDDHVRAIIQILIHGKPGSKYNVGARCERANLSIVEMLCEAVDELRGHAGQGQARKLITFVPDRPGHDFRYAIDPTRLESEIGWAPEESFEEALFATVRWYLENVQWWEPLRRVYQGERLGLHSAGAKHG